MRSVRRRDPPHTRQSTLILAAFRPWGGSRDDAARGVAITVRGTHRASAHRPVASSAEDSPSGLWRSLGKRVGRNPSGVQIPYPPRDQRAASEPPSVMSCAPLYPLPRWRVRAAKGARLESACGGNLTVGSNPTATAIVEGASRRGVPSTILETRGIWEEDRRSRL